jgi:hypothetical protein
MTTMTTTTTASAVSRKLSALGFQKLDNFGIGYVVGIEDGRILVSNKTYSRGTAFVELSAAGYIVNVLSRSECLVTGRHQEILEVLGK